MKALLLALVLSIGIAGCQSPVPSAEEIAKAEQAGLFGPAPADPEGAIRECLRTSLFDPYSVQDFQVSTPEKAYRLRNPHVGGLRPPREFVWGWRVWAQFNAKNRYGAYTGLKLHGFFFPGGGDPIFEQ